MGVRYLLCAVLLAAPGCGGADDAADADAGTIDGGLSGDDAGANPASLGPCLIEKRQTSDQTLLYSESRTYDDAGRLATISHDGGWLYWEADYDDNQLPDGTADRTAYYSYDRNNRLKVYERDEDNDGAIELARYYYYDPVTERQIYYLTDGNIEDGFAPTSQWNLRHDEDGLLVERVHDPSPDGAIHFDKGVDTTLNHQYRYTYDADGRRIESIFDRGFDAAAMGGCDNHKITHIYDDEGRVIRLDLDGHSQIDNCTTAIIDDVIDIAVHYDYDDEGRLWQRRYDDGNDGTIDRREERSFDCP